MTILNTSSKADIAHIQNIRKMPPHQARKEKQKENKQKPEKTREKERNENKKENEEKQGKLHKRQ